MKLRRIIIKGKICLLCSMLPLFLLLSACGGGSGESKDNSETGSISFKLVWQHPADQRQADPMRGAPTGDVCVDYLIETIRAEVYNSAGSLITSASWDCNTPGHSGTIEKVNAGSGIYLIVQGIVAGNPDWRKQTDPFSVAPGEDKNIGQISMEYHGENADQDEDGYASTTAGGSDCNDFDKNIHPGATEACNGVDDDCNDLIDDGLTTATFYRDADGDDFGDPGNSLQSCAAPDGYVTDNTDCNDSKDQIHPGAPDICDGVDNNCSGTADELATPALLSPLENEFVFICDGVTLEWEATAGATSYEVQISESSDMSNPSVQTTADTSYTPSGLSSPAVYYWQVIANDDQGNQSCSTPTRTFTTGTNNILKDIMAGGTNGSYPSGFIAINGILYFSATDGSGYELWRYDGTSVTKIVINPSGSSNPYYLTEFRNQLYFRAYDGSDYELWRYDGATATATKIEMNDTGSSSPSYLKVYNDNLYFSARIDNDTDLYRFNGSVVTPINVNTDGSSYPSNLTIANGALYFQATSANGYEVWRYDGTTKSEIDICPGTCGSYPSSLTASNNALFFSANNGTDTELWKCEGTTASKIDICAGTCSGLPYNLTDVNGVLYFSGSNGTERELWKYQAPATQATMIDINPSGSSYPNNLVNINGVLYFGATWPTIGLEPSVYDGTNHRYLDDINSSGNSNPGFFTELNGKIYFTADSGTQNGVELWSYSPATQSSRMEADICPDGCSSNPQNLVTATLLDGVNRLFFAADNGAIGTEFWSTAGTVPSLVEDINTVQIGTSPDELSAANGKLYFSASDSNNGKELWESDGTFTGTKMAVDINVGPNSSNPRYITAFNGKIYSRATDDGGDYELWELDGANSRKIDLNDTGSSSPSDLIVVNGILYFSATGSTGRELWKYDGTALPKNIEINPSGNGSPYYLTDVDGVLYFRATSEDTEIYRYDGTDLNEIDINQTASSAGSNPYNLTAVGADLYLSANDGVNGQGLWRCTGTTADRVTDTNSGSGVSYPNNLTEMGGNLYCHATVASQQDIYQFNGTSITSLNIPGVLSLSQNDYWYATSLYAANGSLYIILQVEYSDPSKITRLLLRSDGTNVGTELVKDLEVSVYDCWVSAKAYSSGKFYFVLLGEESDWYQIWETDGTASNTIILAEAYSLWTLWNGQYYFYPDLEIFGNRLYYTHYDPQFGPEVWKKCP